MYHSLMLLAGMLALFYNPSLPTVAGICLLAVFSVLFYQSRLLCFRLLATFILAYSWAGLSASYNQSHVLPEALYNQTVLLSACIVGIKAHPPNYQRILFDVSKVSHNDTPMAFKGKASLSDYRADNRLYKNGWCGDLTARLKPVHGRLNRRGFDYEAWAYVQEIKALGTLINLSDFKPGEDIYSRYLQVKSFMVNELSNTLDHAESFALVISLALGERGLISTDVWRVLRQSGTGHLLAISGLHIGLVFWMASTISTLIWRSLGSLSLIISAHKAGWLSGLTFAGGYLVLTGFPLSGRRAWVMLACCVCMWIFDKRIEFKNSLILALWVILLIWPSSILSIGFWFSYVAVALILSQFTHFNVNSNLHSGLYGGRVTGKISDLIKIQCLLSLALSPLNVIYFGEISLISPLANLVAVPLVTFIILPVILVGTIFQLLSLLIISEPLLLFAASCLHWLLNGLTALSDINGSVSMPQITYTQTWYLILIGVFIFYHFRFWPGRWMLGILFLPLLINPNSKLQAGEFELNMFDVGQGLSIWFKSANHNMLIDTGFGIENGFNYFETVIYPVLKAQGVNRLDTLVLSHGDADHVGGMSAIFHSDIDVTRIYSSKLQAETLGAFCEHGITWQWDEIKFSFLTQEQVAGENNQSCILKIRSKFGTVLLPGDIERESELKLVRQFGHLLDAELLIVPHHGSSTSSSQQFLSSVRPELAAVSAGYLNRYGHPTKKIVDRYQKRNVKLLNTACDGELNFFINEQGLAFSQLRRTRQPFWRHRC